MKIVRCILTVQLCAVIDVLQDSHRIADINRPTPINVTQEGSLPKKIR